MQLLPRTDKAWHKVLFSLHSSIFLAIPTQERSKAKVRHLTPQEPLMTLHYTARHCNGLDILA